eukprot:NODE_30_length_37342_cov_0.449507.p23 type:complete len:174 gc:universal NODE_30_length_37342_cov_0.449507:15169-15690(+)
MSEIIQKSQYFWSATSEYSSASDTVSPRYSPKSPTLSDATNVTNAILKQQMSIIRTNCMDCLDRTNVIQTQIAWVVLTNQFLKLGVQLHEYPELSQIFKNMWADNGDQISRCYAGTNAMKNDFTRNGQRDITGFAKDASSSVQRLYLNYVRDGYTQKLLDVLQGLESSEILFK